MPRRSGPSCRYSPYDNVRAQDYPAILALAGLTDPRVTVLGAGEMDRAAAPAAHERQADRVPHQPRRRPLRRRRSVRPPEGSGAGLRLRDQGRRRRRRIVAICVAFDVVTQLGDRSEPQPALRQLGFDRSVRIEGIGHALDHAGFENGDRSAHRPFIGGALLGGAPGVARRFLHRRMRSGDGSPGGGSLPSGPARGPALRSPARPRRRPAGRRAAVVARSAKRPRTPRLSGAVAAAAHSSGAPSC